MVNQYLPNLFPIIVVEHLLFLVLHLFLWDGLYRPPLYSCCLVVFLVYLYPLLKFTFWTTYQGEPGMGCTRSSLERTVCNSDEAEFLTRWKRASTDNSIGSSQSSSDISFIKLEEKDNRNMASGTTCQTLPILELAGF